MRWSPLLSTGREKPRPNALGCAIWRRARTRRPSTTARCRCPVADRAGALRCFVDAIEARSEDIMEVLVAETGCPRHSTAILAQFATPLRMAREIIDFMAALPETEENALPPAETRNHLGQ